MSGNARTSKLTHTHHVGHMMSPI